MEKAADIIETAEMMPELEEVMAIDDVMPQGLVIVEEPQAVEEKEFDLKKNRDLKKFMPHLDKMLNKIPPHSGKTTAGCERAMAHLESLDRMISQVIADDTDVELDDEAIEGFRKKIRKMKKQLKKRHKEINDAYDADDDKYASNETEQLIKAGEGAWTCPECGKEVKPGDQEHKMRHNVKEHGHEADDKKASVCSCETKTAAIEDENCPKCNIKLWKAAEGMFECISCDEVFERKITKEAGRPIIQLQMSPFERAITGTIINGFVSQGKNPEDIYAELKKKYSFTDRDELSIQQILYDMGFNILKDRGHVGDSSEQLNKGKGVEFSTQYNA